MSNDLERRRRLLFTILTACAWRDAPAGPAPVVAGRCGEEGRRATFYPWESLGRREAEAAGM
jgi:hypothetical protein